ncbi:uncharacterized protein LOC129590420 [Paramacrobiotus metropolitanus]|uniref:uncharacterized protein LOC129590420 n=1 Tax=Paramacrobiotus metropolitanus TaxID=2943436 RepID=UPI002445B730|nr:uncharacterized protein LOC129590420 [Paramacrobiotus metropolitanus]
MQQQKQRRMMKSERSASEGERLWEDIGPAQYSARKTDFFLRVPNVALTEWQAHENSDFADVIQTNAKLDAIPKIWYSEGKSAGPLVTDLQAIVRDDIPRKHRQRKKTNQFSHRTAVELEFPQQGKETIHDSSRHAYAVVRSEQNTDLPSDLANFSHPTRRLFQTKNITVKDRTRFPSEMGDTLIQRSYGGTMSQLAVVPFPQTDLCVPTNGPLQKESGCLQKVKNLLINDNAAFRVGLPSGYSLRIPAVALKVYDYGVPRFQDIDPAITADDVRARVQREAAAGSAMDLHERSKDAKEVLELSMHLPQTVGEVLATEFVYAEMEDSPVEPKVFKKVDVNEIIRTQDDKAGETYASLKNCVEEMERPLVDKFVSVQDDQPPKFGHTHNTIRQYLKDYGLETTEQALTKEWWLEHRNNDPDYNLPSVMDENSQLRRSYSVLRREYAALNDDTKKLSSLANRRQDNVQFLTINVRRCLDKNANLQKELKDAKALIPEDYKETLQKKAVIENKYRRMRRLCGHLHARLKAEKDAMKLFQEKQATQNQLQRKVKNARDALFPDYRGTNPYALLTRRKPVQMTRQNGMTVAQRIMAHSGSVLDVAMNPLSSLAISTGADGKWFLWNTGTSSAAPVHHGGGHAGAIGRCEFYPEGTHFATGGCNDMVKIWKTEGQLLTEFHHRSPVSALSIHSSGDFLLTGMSNGMLNLWDMKSSRCRSNFRQWQRTSSGHAGAIVSCQILLFANTAVSAGEDGTARLWDLRTESMQILLKNGAPLQKTQVATSGNIMATAAKCAADIQLWDIRKANAQICAQNYSPYTVCSFDVESSCHMAAVGLDSGSVSFWDLGSGGCTIYPAHAAVVTTVRWDIWAERLLTGDEQGNLYFWS